MSIEIKEILPTGDHVTEDGDVVPGYADESNGPRHPGGALQAELDLFDEPIDNTYDGEVPPEMMSPDSTEYRIWVGQQRAREVLRLCSNNAHDEDKELPSDDNRALFRASIPNAAHEDTYTTVGVIPVPRNRGSARSRTSAMRNARLAEAGAKRHRWGK